MKHDSQPAALSPQISYLDRDIIDKLHDKFRELALEAFGKDCDGDMPLEILLIDRTRYERLYFRPIPYEHKVVTEVERENILSALMTNLGMASEALTRWYRCREYSSGPATATDENLASENRALVERNITIEKELHVMRHEHAVQIRKDEAVKAARAKRDSMTDALDHLWHCEVKSCDECKAYKKRNNLDDKKATKKSGKKKATKS